MNKTEVRLVSEPNEYGGYTKLKFSETDPNYLLAAHTLGDMTIIDARNGSCVK